MLSAGSEAQPIAWNFLEHKKHDTNEFPAEDWQSGQFPSSSKGFIMKLDHQMVDN